MLLPKEFLGSAPGAEIISNVYSGSPPWIFRIKKPSPKPIITRVEDKRAELKRSSSAVMVLMLLTRSRDLIIAVGVSLAKWRGIAQTNPSLSKVSIICKPRGSPTLNSEERASSVTPISSSSTRVSRRASMAVA